MRTTQYALPIIACLVAACVFTVAPVWAVSRTTPVEVTNKPLVGIETGNNIVQAVQLDPWYMNILGTPNFNVANSPTVKIDGTTNTVKIDGTTNTVKAAQSGTWNVGITGTPTVVQGGTWSVGIANTPNVNIANTPSVSVTGTSSVSVSNSPTVKIDATTNAVDTPTRRSTIQLWATDQALANGGTLYSPWISCAGYDEVRAILWSQTASTSITVYVSFRTPTGIFASVKTVGWPTGSIAAVTCPVYGDTCQIAIYNGTGIGINILNHSYVYLVN
jgi:hypothetical protein